VVLWEVGVEAVVADVVTVTVFVAPVAEAAVVPFELPQAAIASVMQGSTKIASRRMV
jgi:hypothetical protein